MSATLRLTREHPLMELRRGPFEIQSDGERIGSLDKLHEIVEIPVEPGRHLIRIRSGRYSSQERFSTSPTARSSISGPADPWSGLRTSRPSSSPSRDQGAAASMRGRGFPLSAWKAA
jgi:hypothetical protein